MRTGHEGRRIGESDVLPATEEEKESVRGYMESQAPDLKVEFLQKVYVENIGSHVHAIWDVHTDQDRWWVITNPTNLYSEQQFPNMDLALTFHVGLCLRIPRSDRHQLADLPIEPFGECFRRLAEASDALAQAREVTDYQAIGVRCREVLLALSTTGQAVVPWEGAGVPKQADFKAWAEHFCNVALPGPSHEERRHLLKSLLHDAWRFTNWLTHAKASTWHDAEAAVTTIEHSVGLTTSAIVRLVRGVPEACPACGSHQLSPERGYRTDQPEDLWERPTCDKCGWAGTPVVVSTTPQAPEPRSEPPEGECSIMEVPLTHLVRP